MSIAMISVSSDVLTRLMALRQFNAEALDEVLHRVLASVTKPAAEPAAQSPSATPRTRLPSLVYRLLDQTHAASDATEAMINILSDLAQYDDDFYPKLAEKIRGRTRNHIGRSRLEVYPGRPDLVRYVKEVGPGWFVGCNIANRKKKKILRAACDVMGLDFDRDLIVNLAHA
jgi:hypothetical protein